ncbi:MAG: hypothetical protein ACR2GY_10770 [Phycisphaerales bacterium]
MHRSLLRILTAIQLTRLTIAFGAVSDVWLMILLARMGSAEASVAPVRSMPLWFALLLGATVAVGLFAYGASLNDVLDARHDSAFSPDRPIPAGRIRAGQAIVVTVGSLLLAILAGQAFGRVAAQITLLTALGILFYNAAGKFIPAIGILTIGILHALQMFIPDVNIGFTLPICFAMTHGTAIALGAYILERKRPRITNGTLAFIAIGWIIITTLIIGWGVTRGRWWPVDRSLLHLLWPLLAAVAFFFVARWKVIGVRGSVAAEKLRRYGAMWQSLYAAMWMFALGQENEAAAFMIFAFAGFAAMTTIKEMMGQLNRPLTYRV